MRFSEVVTVDSCGGVPTLTSTPELALGLSDTGREATLGWRLGLARRGPASLDLALEATRREPANYDTPEHGVAPRLQAGR